MAYHSENFMTRPPEAFIDEYWRMRDRLDWAESALGRGQDVAQAKTVLEEFRAFYQKWHLVITIPDLRQGMEAAHARMEKTLGRGLEKIFLAHLHEVIEARKDWWASEQLFKMSVNFIALMKHSPPEMRPELEKIHRECMKEEFEPVKYYQDAEADAAEGEAKFRKAFAGLAVDWPERVDAAIKERLEKVDGTGAGDWQAEVVAEQAKWAETA